MRIFNKIRLISDGKESNTSIEIIDKRSQF